MLFYACAWAAASCLSPQTSNIRIMKLRKICYSYDFQKKFDKGTNFRIRRFAVAKI